jgi:pimeloyl-ACP methyl ester carboxylesterase
MEIARQTNDAYAMIAAAELSLLNARKTYRKDHDHAVTMLMNAAEISYDYLFMENASTSFSTLKPSYRFMATIYNRAISRLVEIRKDKNEPWPKSASYKHLNSTYDFLVNTDKPFLWNPNVFDQLVPADEIQVSGLKNQYRTEGLGAPLIGFVEKPRENPAFKDYFSHRKQAFALTAVLTFAPAKKMEGNWHRKVVLEFYDPMAMDTISINNKDIPLEADFSTPLGVQLTNVKPIQRGLQGMFESDKLIEKAGMYFLEPYREDKIPVVMVHGLMSSPETWVEMFNDLRGDPQLRRKYQFWFFSYPTGLPILYSSSLLRNELNEIRSKFDPDNNNPDFDQMVLIGHSMGGLLSRQMVQDSKDTYWSSVFAEPIETIEVDETTRELLQNVFYFEPLPFIKRVVFVSTPHRGSDLADMGISRFFAGFIDMPDILNNTANTVFARKDIDFAFDPKEPRKVYNSIELLSPNSRFTITTNKIPLNPDIPYHSIIGTRHDKEGPGSSDGIVPYESSHLDFTVSEKLVPSPHDAQKHPLAIDEVKRILKLHIE